MRGIFVFRRLIFLVVALLCCLPPYVVNAFEVSPIRADLGVAGDAASVLVTVRNPSESPLPIELSVQSRHVGEDGSQRFEPADDNWIIFPPLVSVPPGGSHGIRAQYVGTPPQKTEAYVLYVSQVPVDFSGGMEVQVVYEFGVALYLNPPGTRSDLLVDRVEVSNGVATLHVVNNGDRYGLLSEHRLQLDVGGASATFSPSDLREIIANPVVPARGRRVFTFDVAGALPSGGGSGVVREGQ